MTPVTFVIPVHNGERWLRQTLSAVLAQADGRPLEVLVIDDGSSDGSLAVVRSFEGVTILTGEGRGAAAAINLGIRNAKHPVVCQVDQDVVPHPGWMGRLLAALDSDPTVAAAQGHYRSDPSSRVWARVMALDLEDRYSRLNGPWVDQVCSGNSAYRVQSLGKVGLFDESFGYGYDNDLSYRLGTSGFKLVYCREATSTHHWRESLPDYLRQQFGVGYGRLELVLKHRERVSGDQVSGLGMILHAGLTFSSLCALALGAVVSALGGPGWIAALAAAGFLTGLALERSWVGVRVALRSEDRAALLFPLVHLARDLAWSWAIVVWGFDRLRRQPHRPAASMKRLKDPR